GSKDLEEALVHLKRAVQLDPLNAKYNQALGCQYLKLKNRREALKWLKIAAERGSESDRKFYEGLKFFSLFEHVLGPSDSRSEDNEEKTIILEICKTYKHCSSDIADEL